MKVIYYPSSDNPYISLLYSHIPTNQYSTTPLNSGIFSKYPIIFGVTTLLFRIILFKLTNLFEREVVFHLHWPTFHFAVNNPLVLYLSYLHSMLVLKIINVIGFKLVWTVHNVTPHENWTSNDIVVTKTVVKLADRIICHTNTIKNELIEKYGAEDSKIVVIPIGSYGTVYLNNSTEIISRKKLSIPATTPTILFFGEIKPYKGIDFLIKAHQKILSQGKSIFLLVSGRPWDHNLRKQLEEHQKNNPSLVKVNFDYLDNDDVQYYFNSCDITVFPFRRVTTSSSIILSFSFGKTSIIPDLKALDDFGNEIVYRYQQQNLDSLVETIIESIDNKMGTSKKNLAALQFSKLNNWQSIANKTDQVYLSLLKASQD